MNFFVDFFKYCYHEFCSNNSKKKFKRKFTKESLLYSTFFYLGMYVIEFHTYRVTFNALSKYAKSEGGLCGKFTLKSKFIAVKTDFAPKLFFGLFF